MASALIISPNWIGDAVMALPLLQLLRQQQPALHIAVVAPPWVAPVWRAAAEVGEVIEADFRHGGLQWRERRVLARQLRGRGFDAAYVLPNSWKSALVPWLARIPRRIGYVGEFRHGLLNVVHRDEPQAPRPMLPFYAALAFPPGPAPAKAQLPQPRLQADPACAPAVRERLGLLPHRRWVVFAPGAEFGPAKRWPAAHFAELARRLQAAHPDADVLLLGSPKDRTVGDEITALLPGHGQQVHNLAGRTSLAEAMALIGGAQAMATNDSGLMHIAAALGRPLVALYGPTDPRHTPPASPLATVLWLQIECAPCQQRVCPLGHHRCMRELSADLAWSALAPML